MVAIPFDPDTRARFVERVNAGASDTTLAAEFRVSRQTVWRRRLELSSGGVELKRQPTKRGAHRPITETEIRETVRMASAGATTAEIAAALHRTVEAIKALRRRLRERGVNLPNPPPQVPWNRGVSGWRKAKKTRNREPAPVKEKPDLVQRRCCCCREVVTLPRFIFRCHQCRENHAGVRDFVSVGHSHGVNV